MLTGIDVSAFQSETPPLTGYAFLVARAGYGSGNPADSRYALHARNARAAGIALGAYWFWYSAQNNEVAVAQFLEIADAADFLVLDLEGTNANTTAGRASARDFIARVHAAGRKIGLYHSASGFPALDQDFNWVALWEDTAPTIGWNFWQYAGSPIDHDKFNGDAAALARFVESQGGDAMPTVPISAQTKKLVTPVKGAGIYDLAGKLLTHLAGDLAERESPYGVALAGVSYRVVAITVGGVIQVALLRASECPQRDLPAPTSDPAALAAAALAGAQSQYDLDAKSISATATAHLTNQRPS
ncbi:MAG TPA: GH25 family lysozyme [Nocardioides sp.]|nr:GH25 family lysozyme [Nocardioides sp.]